MSSVLIKQCRRTPGFEGHLRYITRTHRYLITIPRLVASFVSQLELLRLMSFVGPDEPLLYAFILYVIK